MIISSKDNPKIKWAKKLLQSSSFRKKQGLFVIEGLRLCCDAAGNSAEIQTAFYTKRLAERYPKGLSEILEVSDESFEITDQVLEKISDTENGQGILCVCKIPELCLNPKRGGRYLVLENLSDPSNVGAAARTAEALGLDGMLICGGCDPYRPKVLRASMGALLRFPLQMFEDVTEAAELLDRNGIPLYCSVVSGADCGISDVDFSSGGAVIIGNEGFGASDAARKLSKTRFTIPMSGRAESLNAAAAAAIIIYEMTKG